MLMFASSESKSANKSEFTIINFHTWKNGLLLAGLPLCTVMSILGSRFLDPGYRHAVTAALIVVIVALVFLYVKESRRTSTLIVADDKLQHESEVLLPGEITRIELHHQNVFIRRKGWRNLSLLLKNRDDLEPLTARLREFGSRHNIKVEVVE
jgi:hypothetical protein